VLLVIGTQGFFLGCISQVLFDFTGRKRECWLGIFPYTGTVLIALGLAVLGVGLCIPLAVAYANNGLVLTNANFAQDHLAATGLASLIAGAQLFVFVLVLHGAAVATRRNLQSDQ
jgi:hypothetical protein